MKSITILLALVLSLSSFAQSRGDVLREIRRKLVQIDDKTYDTELDSVELVRILKDLEKVRRSLADNSGSPTFQACVDYSFPILDRYLNASDALDRAMSICPQVSDIAVLNFIFTELDKSLSGRDAIEKAALVTRQDLEGKLEILTFAFEKHDRNMSGVSAIEKSVKNARINNSYAINCFQKYYPTYNRSQSSSAAMDRTAQTCSQF